MALWQRKSQEKDGTYFFSGQFYVTQGVSQELSLQEIISIYRDVQDFVKEKDGVDYLQVYIDGRGRKLYFIDQLNTEMLLSGHYHPQDNHCTLMFAHEY